MYKCDATFLEWVYFVKFSNYGILRGMISREFIKTQLQLRKIGRHTEQILTNGIIGTRMRQSVLQRHADSMDAIFGLRIFGQCADGVSRNQVAIELTVSG